MTSRKRDPQTSPDAQEQAPAPEPPPDPLTALTTALAALRTASGPILPPGFIDAGEVAETLIASMGPEVRVVAIRETLADFRMSLGEIDRDGALADADAFLADPRT